LEQAAAVTTTVIKKIFPVNKACEEQQNDCCKNANIFSHCI
jgi:hypothetical protein